MDHLTLGLGPESNAYQARYRLRLQMLLRGIWSQRQCTLEEFVAATRTSISRAALWRLLVGTENWSQRGIDAVVACIAAMTNLTPRAVIRYAHGEDWSHAPMLSVLEQCEFHHPVKSDALTPLAEQVIRSQRFAKQLLYFGRVLPPHILPEEPTFRCNLRIAASLATRPRSLVSAFNSFGAAIHEDFMLEMVGSSTCMTIFVFKSDFQSLVCRRRLFSGFGSHDTLDVLGTLAYDAIEERRTTVGVINDDKGSVPVGLLERLKTTAFLLAIGDNFLIKRDQGSPTFAASVRRNDPDLDYWLDDQLSLLKSLGEFVPHQLDQSTSFEIVSDYLASQKHKGVKSSGGLSCCP